MTLTARMRAAARATLLPLLLAALTALAACAAPSPEAPQPATGAVAQTQAPAAAKPAPATPASTPAGEEKLRYTGGPLPPERVGDRIDGDARAAEVTLDMSCRTDADCTVKNVGNCCGNFPACVNVNSPTDPKGVQDRCARQGMSSVCGYADISACSCVQGKCEAAGSGEVVR